MVPLNIPWLEIEYGCRQAETQRVIERSYWEAAHEEEDSPFVS